MQFSLTEWRRLYDLVHEHGRILADARPTYDRKLNYNPPKSPRTKDEEWMLEVKIKTLTQRSNTYLDQCGMKMKKPLWHYDRHNKETHKSSPDFRYAHLLE